MHEEDSPGIDAASLHASLPVVRFEFVVRQRDFLHLPDYAGSMLRGAFGAALRRIACMTGASECKGCPLLMNCSYPAIFETRVLQTNATVQPVNAYVIEPPPHGAHDVAVDQDWCFHMVLAGRVLRQLPLIVFALQRACERGFGHAASRAELHSVALCNGALREPLQLSGGIAIDGLEWPPPEPVELRDGTAMRFTTPLRMQENGRILDSGEISASDILMSLARRVQNLIDCHGEGGFRLPFSALAASAARTSASASLQRYRWSRYSSRQKQEIDLSGLVGEVRLRGDLAPFAALLALGALVHVGKGATFGLGRYELYSACAVEVGASDA